MQRRADLGQAIQGYVGIRLVPNVSRIMLVPYLNDVRTRSTDDSAELLLSRLALLSNIRFLEKLFPLHSELCKHLGSRLVIRGLESSNIADPSLNESQRKSHLRYILDMSIDNYQTNVCETLITLSVIDEYSQEEKLGVAAIRRAIQAYCNRVYGWSMTMLHMRCRSYRIRQELYSFVKQTSGRSVKSLWSRIVGPDCANSGALGFAKRLKDLGFQGDSMEAANCLDPNRTGIISFQGFLAFF